MGASEAVETFGINLKKDKMRTCPECGSMDLVVRLPAERTYAQGPAGKWTDQGVEHLAEKPTWYCSDCDNCWYEWFSEAVEEG